MQHGRRKVLTYAQREMQIIFNCLPVESRWTSTRNGLAIRFDSCRNNDKAAACRNTPIGTSWQLQALAGQDSPTHPISSTFINETFFIFTALKSTHYLILYGKNILEIFPNLSEGLPLIFPPQHIGRSFRKQKDVFSGNKNSIYRILISSSEEIGCKCIRWNDVKASINLCIII